MRKNLPVRVRYFLIVIEESFGYDPYNHFGSVAWDQYCNSR